MDDLSAGPPRPHKKRNVAEPSVSLCEPGGIGEAWFRRVLPHDLLATLCSDGNAQARAQELLDWMERADSLFRKASQAFAGIAKGLFLHLRVSDEVRQRCLPLSTPGGYPAPLLSLRVLLNHSLEGGDAGELLDQTGRARVASSVLPQSLATYLSHLKTVCGFCALLYVDAVPASPDVIKRYAAFINHPVTLRGHLAAWKLWHTVTGYGWRQDPWVWAAHKALLKHRPGQGRQRYALRRDVTIRLVKHWISKESYRLAFVAALSYFHMLRIPSELFRQFRLRLLKCHPRVIEYGPIRRKGQNYDQVLRRRCCCKSFPLLCPHSWQAPLTAFGGESMLLYGQWNLSGFNEQLRVALKHLEVADADSFSSHAFRRGGAQDTLAHEGLAAMLHAGGWSSESRAALAYTTIDDIEQRLMGEVLACASDSE